MKAVQMFEEKADEKGRSLFVTEAHKFAWFIGVFRSRLEPPQCRVEDE